MKRRQPSHDVISTRQELGKLLSSADPLWPESMRDAHGRDLVRAAYEADSGWHWGMEQAKAEREYVTVATAAYNKRRGGRLEYLLASGLLAGEALRVVEQTPS